MVALFEGMLKVRREAAIRVPVNQDPNCGAYGGVAVPTKYTTGNFQGADLVIFLTAWPTVGQQQLAWALSCRFSSIWRPLMGQINIGPRKVDEARPYDLQRTILHELIHVLGFSADDWPYFYDANTDARRPVAEVLSAVNLYGSKPVCGALARARARSL